MSIQMISLSVSLKRFANKCSHSSYWLLLALCTAPFILGSCVEEEQFDSTPRGNMEALWRIMDEHYCFFDVKKQQLGVDWDEVHTRYATHVNNSMSRYQLFELLTSMIGELRDGHVNLSAAFDYGRNWSWKEDYPMNFYDALQNNYLGTDYRISGGMKYRILDDNTGYVYCPSFEYNFGAGNLDEIMLHLAPCSKLILDVRGNGGGMISSAQHLAARFTNKELLVGYIQHKNGRGHDDFSEMEEQRLKPAEGIRWQKKVCVLTNRSVFSAANEFVKYMKAIKDNGTADKIIIVGDCTGGGAGMPFSSELPNGWGVRFSACPMYDVNKNSTEFGISPDVKVDISNEDYSKGIDTILEVARKL